MALFKKAEAKAEEWSGPESLKGMLVPLSELHHDDKNVRRHPERNIEVIKASLTRFGQRKPIVVQREGMVVRAGNGTMIAAQALGWTHLAVVITDDDNSTAAQYAVADNRAGELAEWDTDSLLEQLQSTDELGALGFTLDEVHNLIDLRENPFVTDRVSVEDLKDHPRNYQTHPEDQLSQIMQSLTMHGFYRNVVVARDNTILAGHGVVLAARRMGKKRVPVIRLDVDPNEPRALKVLTSDNEISNLAQTDDRALTELLRDIMGTSGLEGTGYTDQQLAALTMVTRHKSEIPNFDAAAEWVGMPSYDVGGNVIELHLKFETVEARREAVRLLGLAEEPILKKVAGHRDLWSSRWPEQKRDSLTEVEVRAS